MKGEPQGERIIIHGRVLDENGLPVPRHSGGDLAGQRRRSLQHKRDLHDAPLDPNFTGTGRTVTDADGWYQFQTIKPGAYPWGNHHNAWRPAHIHFSLFGAGILHAPGHADVFPRRPAAGVRPDLQLRARCQGQRAPDRHVRLGKTIPSYALGYRWDIVLRGRKMTVWEKSDEFPIHSVAHRGPVLPAGPDR